MNIYPQNKIKNLYHGDPIKENWTAIIPAAGRGSRLGFSKPKILYPIANRPILDWLIDLLEPHCGKMIFVISPSGYEHVLPALKSRLGVVGNRFEVAIQDEPRGMADAIFHALEALATKNTLIIWGDQVAVRPATIRDIMNLHEYKKSAQLTMPIVKRENPYVHYVVNSIGLFTDVLEKREGAPMPRFGESDCGVFAFNTYILKSILKEEMRSGIIRSKSTNEWNFLPILPRFESGGESINAIRLESLEETIGVNDKHDAVVLEKYLSQS